MWIWLGRAVLFAVAVAVTAGVLSWVSMKHQFETLRRQWEPVQILCAKHDLKRGAALVEADVALRDFPQRFTTEDFIVWPDDARGQHLVSPIGMKLKIDLREGDPLLFPFFEEAR